MCFKGSKKDIKPNTLVKPNVQQSLQPSVLTAEEPAYKNVEDIAYRLQMGDAQNIALTGPYGSGKSTILKTIQRDCPNYKYLNISLATLKPFQPEKEAEEDEDGGENSESLNRLIEYSILQQLIYREKQDTLPNSRFKRIYKIEKKRKVRLATAVLLAVAALIILFEPEFLRIEWIFNLLSGKWLNIIGDSLSIIYLTVFAYKFCSWLINYLSGSRLNKINLKDGEIEIEESASIFNKHLDEILYFFQETEYNVVVFEDLDRFKTSDIFIKLRELNQLINESKIVGRKVIFMYAVRDDMFQNSDRSKCFDYISTVIPVINRSNSKDVLKDELALRGVTDIKDKDLKELGFFVNDMRLLKNIANEYVQYSQKIEKYEPAKLLAMIIYKNYHPRDFAELHDCKGIVYNVLQLKETFFTEKIMQIDKEQAKISEEQELRRKNQHLKEKELRVIYLNEYRKKLGVGLINIQVNGSEYSVQDIEADEKLFDSLISQNKITYTHWVNNPYNYYRDSTTIQLPLSSVEQAVDSRHTYKQRLQAIRTEYVNEPKIKISFDKQREEIRSLTVSQLMASIDYHNIEGYEKLNVPPMIEYFLVSGYINEDYYDYISYFYGAMITPHDWNFVLDLKLKKEHNYDYPIDSVEATVGEIPNRVYRTLAILNVHILDYLAENCEVRTNRARISVLFKIVVEKKKFDFLAAYYKIGKFRDKVFEFFFSEHNDLFNEFSVNLDLMCIWIKYAELEQSTIESREWIADRFYFINDNVSEFGEQLINELIKKYNYQFKELVHGSSEVLDCCVASNSYELHKENVCVIVDFLKEQEDESTTSSSYSVVCSTNRQEFIDRIDENLEECLTEIFSEPSSKNETTSSILRIFNDENLSDDVKVRYLTGQSEKVEVSDITKLEFKTMALTLNIAAPNWKSIHDYISECGSVDSAVDEFVKVNIDYLTALPLPEDKPICQNLLSWLVNSNSISMSVYPKLVKKFGYWRYGDYTTLGMEEGRLALMIERGMLEYSHKTIANLSDNYSSALLSSYLVLYKKEFLEEPDVVAYDGTLANALMSSSLKDKEKVTLVPYFEESIYDAALAEKVLELLTKYEIELAFDVAVKVISLSRNLRNKLTVVKYNIEKNSLTADNIDRMLDVLPEPYCQIADHGKKPLIPKGDEVKSILESLKNQGYIYSFKEDKDKYRVYTKPI